MRTYKKPVFTTKHYETIANWICIGMVSSAEDVSFDFADLFIKDNPRFNENRFLKVCGIPQYQ